MWDTQKREGKPILRFLKFHFQNNKTIDIFSTLPGKSRDEAQPSLLAHLSFILFATNTASLSISTSLFTVHNQRHTVAASDK